MEGSSADTKSKDNQEPIDSCLPFRLQDLCLIAIINELDSYPVDWLALLPLKIRYRLLTNLPVLDLCRLDHTPVAEGIAVHEIWSSKSRCSSIQEPLADLFMIRENHYMYFTNVDDIPGLDPELVAAFSNDQRKKLSKEWYLLKAAWNILSYLSLNYKLAHANPSMLVFEQMIAVQGHQFLQDTIRIPRSKDYGMKIAFFQVMEEIEEYHQLWNKQVTGLTVLKASSGEDLTHIHAQLVPRHFCPILKRADLVELLNYIVIKCDLYPASQTIDVLIWHQAYSSTGNKIKPLLKRLLNKIVVLALKKVSIEQLDTLRDIFDKVVGFGKDCTLKALEIHNKHHRGESSSPKMKATVNLEFLSPYLFTLPSDDPSLPRYQGLSVLELGSALEPSSLPHLTALLQQQVSLKHIRICLLDSCKGQSKTVIRDERQSVLHLDQSGKPIASTADEKRLYSVLMTLYQRKHFHSLRICFVCRRTFHECTYGPFNKSSNCQNLFPFTELLRGFMQSPCENSQNLSFEFINSLPPEQPLPLILTVGGDTTPDCGTQNKTVKYELTDSEVIVPHLLQLPVIRLQELVFDFTEDSQPFFSQAANHPSLHVAKLVLHIDLTSANMKETLPTLRKDLKRLLQMPTLKEIKLCGDWTYCSKVRRALMAALTQKPQTCSLQKIHLEQRNLKRGGISKSIFKTMHFTISEIKELWGAIFSLPQLDQLEVELSESLSPNTIMMAGILLKCWENSAPKKKLKFLKLNLDRETSNIQDIELLTKIAQEVTVHVPNDSHKGWS